MFYRGALAVPLLAVLVFAIAGCNGGDRRTVVVERSTYQDRPVYIERGSPQAYPPDSYESYGNGSQEAYEFEDPAPYPDWQALDEDFESEYIPQYRDYSEVPIYSEPEEPYVEQTRAEVSFDFFYTSLAPYGTWFRHRAYGWVWFPRDVPIGWRPYTQGRWVLTQEYGWMWVSDHRWGWAPFHYGRWALDPVYGWIWVPGTTWAPAWVAWRTGDQYVGWAPLPPEAVWQPQRGLVFQAGFSFDRLSWRRWNFVQARYFYGGDVSRHVLLPARNVTIINNTTNVTNIVNVDNRIVNRSVDVRRLERVAGRPIRPLRVRNVTNVNINVEQRITNNEVNIYRPRVRRVDARPEPPASIRQQARRVDLDERRQRLTRELQERQRTERDALRRQQEIERQRLADRPQELQQRLRAEERALERQQQLERRQIERRLAVERDPERAAVETPATPRQRPTEREQAQPPRDMREQAQPRPTRPEPPQPRQAEPRRTAPDRQAPSGEPVEPRRQRDADERSGTGGQIQRPGTAPPAATPPRVTPDRSGRPVAPQAAPPTERQTPPPVTRERPRATPPPSPPARTAPPRAAPDRDRSSVAPQAAPRQRQTAPPAAQDRSARPDRDRPDGAAGPQDRPSRTARPDIERREVQRGNNPSQARERNTRDLRSEPRDPDRRTAPQTQPVRRTRDRS